MTAANSIMAKNHPVRKMLDEVHAALTNPTKTAITKQTLYDAVRKFNQVVKASKRQPAKKRARQ